MDITNLTLEELYELQESINSQIKSIKEANRETEKANALERAARFVGSLNDGDTVKFLFGRDNEEAIGTVVRTSDKSATIQSDVFDGEKDTRYIRYDRILDLVASAPASTDETDSDETSLDEDEELEVAV